MGINQHRVQDTIFQIYLKRLRYGQSVRDQHYHKETEVTECFCRVVSCLLCLQESRATGATIPFDDFAAEFGGRIDQIGSSVACGNGSERCFHEDRWSPLWSLGVLRDIAKGLGASLNFTLRFR